MDLVRGRVKTFPTLIVTPSVPLEATTLLPIFVMRRPIGPMPMKIVLPKEIRSVVCDKPIAVGFEEMWPRLARMEVGVPSIWPSSINHPPVRQQRATSVWRIPIVCGIPPLATWENA